MMHACIVKMILEHENSAKLSKKERELRPAVSFQSDAGVGRELRERVEMLEEEKVSKSEADKEKANSRLGAYMGYLKEARGEAEGG